MSLSVIVHVRSVCVCLSVCVCVLSHSACASVCSLHTLPLSPSQSCFVWQPSQVPGAAWHGADWPAHVHTCTRVRMSAHRHPRTSLCVPTSASIYQYMEGRASSWTSGDSFALGWSLQRPQWPRAGFRFSGLNLGPQKGRLSTASISSSPPGRAELRIIWFPARRRQLSSSGPSSSCTVSLEGELLSFRLFSMRNQAFQGSQACVHTRDSMCTHVREVACM